MTLIPSEARDLLCLFREIFEKVPRFARDEGCATPAHGRLP
jgi:hypothetical protein